MPPTADRWRTRRVARVVALATVPLLAAGVTGCSGSSGDAGAAAARPTGTAVPDGAGATTRPGVDGRSGLSAQVLRYRRDAQRDVVQVKVTSSGDRAVHVGRVEVRSPTFVTAASADTDATVAPGASVDLVVPLAEPACPAVGGAVATGTGSPTAGHAVVLVVDGTRVELPVAGRVLEQVRSQRCAEAAVAAVVELAWAPGWVDAGLVDDAPGLRGRLVASPVSGDAAVDLAVRAPTTLFTVERPATATAVADPVALEVVVTVTRCDPHAVAEDKKGYLFPVQVRVDGAAEVVVEVAVTERAALQDLIDRTCR